VVSPMASDICQLFLRSMGLSRPVRYFFAAWVPRLLVNTVSIRVINSLNSVSKLQFTIIKLNQPT
jgi:hypothetical protein